MPDSVEMSALEERLHITNSTIAPPGSRVIAGRPGDESLGPVTSTTLRFKVQTLKFSVARPIYLGDLGDHERERGDVGGGEALIARAERARLSTMAPEVDVAAQNACSGPMVTGHLGCRSTRRDRTVISGFGDKGGGRFGARLICRALEAAPPCESARSLRAKDPL
jgi:hypothetical protein